MFDIKTRKVQQHQIVYLIFQGFRDHSIQANGGLFRLNEFLSPLPPPYPLPCSINLSEKVYRATPSRFHQIQNQISSEVIKRINNFYHLRFVSNIGFISKICELSIFCLIRPTNFEIDAETKMLNAISIYCDE